ncbi:MAG: hypothetical protein LUG55_11350 [Clostridiales bacterium]|nr:hypothetical protein [Clostridiales bacterium]
MAVILNLAVAIVIEIGMYSIGRKDGHDAAWAEIKAAAKDEERWQALTDELAQAAKEAEP